MPLNFFLYKGILVKLNIEVVLSIVSFNEECGVKCYPRMQRSHCLIVSFSISLQTLAQNQFFFSALHRNKIIIKNKVNESIRKRKMIMPNMPEAFLPRN